MKIIALIVGLVTGILLITGIVSPLVATGTAEEITKENTGSYYTTPDEDDHTLIFTNQDYAVVDGVNVDYPEGFGTGNQKNVTVMIGTDWMLRLDNGYARLIAAGPNNGYAQENISSSGLEVTISGSDVTFTISGSTKNLTGLQYYLAPEGDWVLCYNPYIKEDTTLIGGIRGSGNNSNNIGYDIFEVVTGSVADGFEATNCRAILFTSPSTFPTITSVFEANTAEVVTDLLKLTSITQDVTFDDESTATITISYLLAPKTIVYDNPAYVGAGNMALLAVLPIIALIVLIAYAAYSIRGREFD